MPSSTPPSTPLPRLLLVAGLLASLAGCATVSEKGTDLFSSNTPATAVFDGRVLFGQANFTSAREATLQLQASDAPGLACSGVLRFNASMGGTVGFTCSDGRAATVPFQAFSALSGAGRNQAGAGEFALTYGLAPDKAAGFLGVAADRLVRPGGS